MSLEVSGKIIKKLDVQSGTSSRGEWKKQDFVIETMDQFPKKVCISLWGDKVQELENYQEGHSIKCSINIESREYNGRWYTDIKAWRMEPFQTQSAEGGSPVNIQSFDDVADGPSNDEDVDDLPF
jgi:hypothetical protein